MGSGCARAFFMAAMLAVLSGCAGNEPRAILTAAELDAMIRVEVEQIEPGRRDDNVVAAALQP